MCYCIPGGGGGGHTGTNQSYLSTLGLLFGQGNVFDLIFDTATTPPLPPPTPARRQFLGGICTYVSQQYLLPRTKYICVFKTVCISMTRGQVSRRKGGNYESILRLFSWPTRVDNLKKLFLNSYYVAVKKIKQRPRNSFWVNS